MSIYEDCYEYLHTQSFETAAEEIAGFCRRNGGDVVMILYHSTNIDFDAINLGMSKPNKDFGRAFYLSAKVESTWFEGRRVYSMTPSCP